MLAAEIVIGDAMVIGGVERTVVDLRAVPPIGSRLVVFGQGMTLRLPAREVVAVKRWVPIRRVPARRVLPRGVVR
ncbi:hypothetical protein GCM10027160_23140 [Streptomyces calidiresistens]